MARPIGKVAVQRAATFFDLDRGAMAINVTGQAEFTHH